MKETIFRIDDVVMINDKTHPAHGLVGKITDIRIFFKTVLYKVYFGFDVGQYTTGKKSIDYMFVDPLHLAYWEVEYEIDTLINLALDTKDKEWFEELISMKNNGIKSDVMVFDEELNY